MSTLTRNQGWLEALRSELDPAKWRVAAAVLGPGFAGKRVETNQEERREAAKTLLAEWPAEFGAPPAYLREIADGKNAEWIERKAKLFECGEFSDRGVNVSPADLQKLASSFDSPVPILIEHTETPLRLGYLTDVEAIGAELFGTLALTKEANDFIEDSAAKSLSLSVSKSLDKIHEVSIVSNPRIESAKLFCKDFRDCEPISEWKREAISLREKLANDEIEKAVAQFNLSPAVRNRAIELLRCAKDERVKECVLELLAAIPKTVHFGEIAPAGPISSHDLSAEEERFYTQHFPGIDPRDIAKRRF